MNDDQCVKMDENKSLCGFIVADLNGQCDVTYSIFLLAV